MDKNLATSVSLSTISKYDEEITNHTYHNARQPDGCRTAD